MPIKHMTAQEERNADFDAAVKAIIRDTRRVAKDSGSTLQAAFDFLKPSRFYGPRVVAHARTQLGLDPHTVERKAILDLLARQPCSLNTLPARYLTEAARMEAEGVIEEAGAGPDGRMTYRLRAK
jgi:hypothetical protein